MRPIVGSAHRYTWQRTPLHLAAQHDFEPLARLLIQKGANINALNDESETPLYVSLGTPYANNSSPKYKFHRSKTFEYLVTLDQNVQVINRRGRTLLHRTCHPEYIGILLDKGAPKYLHDNDGVTPLFFALEQCPPESVAMYFKRGFDVKSAGVGGKTVTLAALNNPYFRHEMLEFVIEQGADVAQQDALGRSAIHQAAAHSPQILDLVIQHGGDINARTRTNATPLHVAASINVNNLILKGHQNQRELNNESYAHLLGQPGIEVNVKDAKGCTPLHRAVNSGNLEMIQLLLEHGIDVNAKEERGHSAMDMAVLRKDQRMISLFEQAGATSAIDQNKSYRVLCTYP